MSSDRIGKYRERASRSRTPYSRPKGLIRRVTDSVSGLLGGSWIPGFLRGDESEERNQHSGGGGGAEHNHQQQPGPSGYNRASSSSNLQLSPRSLAAIYPEEAGISDVSFSSSMGSVSRSRSSPAAGGGSADNNTSPVRPNFSAAPAAAMSAASTNASVSAQDHSNTDGGVCSSRLLPESGFRENYQVDQQVFSTPQSSQAQQQYSNAAGTSQQQYSSAAGTSQQQFPAVSTPLQYSAAGTSEQFSFQQHSKFTPVVEGRSITQRRPLDQLEGVCDSAVSTPSARLGSAQSSSKRPRFSLAAYSAAASPVGNKSILSDGSFRSSPFYPGRTIFGGAASHRRTPTPNRSATASPRFGGPPNDGGLSVAAQRILSSLNAMSTPLTDAKRIPTPSASPYTSYLDSPYTAAFHKHRPSRPPTAPLNTPAKVGIQSNLSQYVFPGRGPNGSNSSQPQQSTTSNHGITTNTSSSNKADHSFLDPAASSASSAAQQPSIFSVAAASATRSSVAASSGSSVSHRAGSSVASNPLLQPSQPLFSGSRDRLPSIPEAAAGSSTSPVVSSASEAISFASSVSTGFSFSASSAPANEPIGSGGGGKIKSTKMNSQSRPSRSALLNNAWEEVTVPDLPNASLPKMLFTAPISLGSHKTICTPSSTAAAPVGPRQPSTEAGTTTPMFKFSAPEVLLQRERTTSSEGSATSHFSFSAPPSVLAADVAREDNFVVPKSSFVPKVKPASPVKSVVTVDSAKELVSKPGSLLEFLKKSSDSDVNGSSKNKDNEKESSSKNPPLSSTGWGDMFKVASGSWECGVCLVRNKAEDSKCLSCETPKPGQSGSSITTQFALVSGASNVNASKQSISSVGFGDKFKKSLKDWDCDTCLLRNKESDEKCVSCQALKPGSKSSSSAGGLAEPSTFSFGVKSTATSSSISFGVPSNSVSNGTATTASTTSGFSFGGKPVSSTSSSEFSFGIKPVSVSAATSSSTPASTATSSISTNSTVSFTAGNSDRSKMPSITGFGAAFKKAAGDWECSVCLVNNKSSHEKCVSCESAKPVAATATPPTTKELSNDTTTTNKPDDKLPQGFGDRFKKSAGDWDCDSCLVSNKSASVKCISCESPKPGSVDSSKVLTGNFKFGNANKSSESNFKFGVASPSSNTLSSSANNVASFGVSTPAAASTFSFGCQAAAAAATDSTKPATFSFGVQSNGSIQAAVPKTAAVADPVVPTTSTPNSENFSFVPSTTQSQTLKSKIVQNSVNPASELEKGSVLDFLKSSTEKPSNATEKVPSTPFSFGNPSNNVSATDSTAIPSFSFSTTTAAPKPSFAFGSNTSDSGKTVNLFGNASSPAKTDIIAKTSNKRSLNEDEDSNKKSNCSFTKNNGISENSSSQFSFGNKMPVSASSPPPPMFTFGQAPSAAAPNKPMNTFGSAAPAFGSFGNNNNNNVNDSSKIGAGAAAPTFAFGQPSEKKPGASFDFGQPSPSAPSFNFGSAAPTSFQFGQSNTNNGNSAPSNNGIFQFGSGPAPAGAVTSSFGGAAANPFSQTPSNTPSGRVVKRAIRRTKK